MALYYESTGTGEALVLAHAGIADARQWDAQIAAFEPHYRVIRFDAQGFGRSAAAEQPATRAQDIYDLLRSLSISRAHLVGVSMGGSAVIDFAVEHPEMIGALIPVAAGLSGYERRGDTWMEEQEALQDAAWERGDIATSVDIDLRVWLAGPGRRVEDMDAALRERTRDMARLAQERAAERTPTPQIEPPAAKRLGDIWAPTLVMVGDQDVQLILDIADYLASHIPGARKLVFADTAHMVNMERPAEFNRALLAFLQEAAASRGAGRS